ncbi:MAG TPA: hypothetical protein VGG39_14975 [Polyangiaceae bacterium]|jgi:hypothetical protein
MQPIRRTSGALGLALAVGTLATGALATACGGTHAASKPPATAQGSVQAQPATPEVPGSPLDGAPGDRSAQAGASADDDAQLVIAADVVARCPLLGLVRSRVGDFDPDTVWLIALESIADCMSRRGPMAGDNLGVSGDEDHRHVVRRVLGARGVSPTRVVARAASRAGAAECQGGAPCNRRIEITLVP